MELNHYDETTGEENGGVLYGGDARTVLEAVKEELQDETYQFYAGTSYRHCLIWDKGQVAELVPPHDVLGQKIGQHLPEDAHLRHMMKVSYQILKDHP